MPNPVTIKVEGLQELGRNFKRLSLQMQNKTAKAAVARATKIVREHARAHHPEWQSASGALEKAIGSRRITKLCYPGFEVWAVGVFKISGRFIKNPTGRRVGRVGQKWSAMKEVDQPSYYWKFLEYGTVKMNAKPFIRPALEQNVGRAIDVMRDEIRKGIDMAVGAL